jgi:hypothetical protein
MAYVIEVFGSSYAAGVALPIKGIEQPVGIGRAASGMIDLPGGNSWDSTGSAQTRLRSQIITIRGGWVSATAADMTTKIDALRALVGTRDYLWATPDSGTTKRSRLARCLDVRATVRPRFPRWMQVEMDFELVAGPWAGAAHTAESTTLDAGTHDVVTTNAGNTRVQDAIMTITASGSAITAISVLLAARFHWHWTGSISAAASLIVNGGTRRITNGGNDAYSTFALQADHADNDWLPLDPGINTISVERTGGDNSSTCKLDYSDGWS